MKILQLIEKFIVKWPILSVVINFGLIIFTAVVFEFKWQSKHEEKIARECPKFITEECVAHCKVYGVLDTEVNTECRRGADENK